MGLFGGGFGPGGLGPGGFVVFVVLGFPGGFVVFGVVLLGVVVFGVVVFGLVLFGVVGGVGGLGISLSMFFLSMSLFLSSLT